MNAIALIVIRTLKVVTNGVKWTEHWKAQNSIMLWGNLISHMRQRIQALTYYLIWPRPILVGWLLSMSDKFMQFQPFRHMEWMTIVKCLTYKQHIPRIYTLDQRSSHPLECIPSRITSIIPYLATLELDSSWSYFKMSINIVRTLVKQIAIWPTS